MIFKVYLYYLYLKLLALNDRKTENNFIVTDYKQRKKNNKLLNLELQEKLLEPFINNLMQ